MLCYPFIMNTSVKHGLGTQQKSWQHVYTMPDFFIFPITYIKSCVAYCNMEFDFGRIIGKERIYVVSPLSE